MNSIKSSLVTHYRDVKYGSSPFVNLNNSILGVFAYGSMNYGTWREGISDVDSKTIIVPHFHQLVFDTPIILEHKIENEQSVIMDIRHFAKNVKKQNINFTEIMFTEYSFFPNLTPFDCARAEIWKYYMVPASAERLARYDEAACIKSICGQALHTIHQNPTDGKKIANAVRLDCFLERYLSRNFSYTQCIQPEGFALANILELKYSSDPVDEKIGEKLIAKFHNYLNIADTSKLQENKDWGDEYLNKMIRDLIAVDLQLTK